jgi:nicotinamide-nucleotide amidase
MNQDAFPNAEIIAVGSEMLTPGKVDTNSLFLTGELNALGVEVVRKSVVGDDRDRLASTFRMAIDAADVVILTGGLGPSEDVVTRDAAAAAVGRTQVFRQEIADAIAERFRLRGRKMADINKRQAFIIEGAEILPNPRGTAPGQWITHNSAVVMLLPGPPGELKPMFVEQCMPRLSAVLPAQVIRTRFYRVAGMPESDLDALIAPVYTKYANPVTTILAAAGDIQIHLRARCATCDEAEALLAEVGIEIEALLGDRIYSSNGDPIEVVIGQRLRALGATLSVAESATGGMLGARITSVSGSSDYFAGGFITYATQLKIALAGVPEDTIQRHGVVSEEVAKAMAEGVRARTGSTYALSVTGIAGPGSAGDPVPPGTMVIGFAGPDGNDARRVHLPGDRTLVRQFTVQTALDFLRRKLAST